MRDWLNRASVVAAAAVVAWSFASSRTTGQAQLSRITRAPDGHPNLNGLWQAVSNAYWDLEDHAARQGPLIALGAAYSVPEGSGVVDGGTIPYRPEALAKKKENFAKSQNLLQALAKQGNVGPRFAEEDYKVIDPEIP